MILRLNSRFVPGYIDTSFSPTAASRLCRRSFHGWGGINHSKPCGGYQQVECGGRVWLHKQPGWMCRIHTGEERGRSEREEGTEAAGRLTSNLRAVTKISFVLQTFWSPFNGISLSWATEQLVPASLWMCADARMAVLLFPIEAMSVGFVWRRRRALHCSYCSKTFQNEKNKSIVVKLVVKFGKKSFLLKTWIFVFR